MKTKKTIRKMTPLARKVAHLTRSLHSIVKRLDYLTNEVMRVEMQALAAEKSAKKSIADAKEADATPCAACVEDDLFSVNCSDCCPPLWEGYRERMVKSVEDLQENTGHTCGGS
jgi:hypothetical protein